MINNSLEKLSGMPGKAWGPRGKVVAPPIEEENRKSKHTATMKFMFSALLREQEVYDRAAQSLFTVPYNFWKIHLFFFFLWPKVET